LTRINHATTSLCLFPLRAAVGHRQHRHAHGSLRPRREIQRSATRSIRACPSRTGRGSQSSNRFRHPWPCARRRAREARRAPDRWVRI